MTGVSRQFAQRLNRGRLARNFKPAARLGNAEYRKSLLCKAFARWCNGSTSDSGSLSQGSNPCRAISISPTATLPKLDAGQSPYRADCSKLRLHGQHRASGRAA
jgi:hypothetical protein